MASQLTPLLAERVVRLGTWLPFRHAATMFTFFSQTALSASSVRRLSEAVGAAGEELLEQAAAQPPARPEAAAPSVAAHLYVGVDGCMVPLVGGEWAEVKTLSVGEVPPPVMQGDKAGVHTTQLSYFSRLADADRFMHLAGVELDRRQVAQAERVCGVSDGARWIQRFFDNCCAQARRILDFPHAVGYLAQAGAAYFEGSPEVLALWLAAQRKELKEGQPARVVAELHRLSLQAHEQDLSQARQASLADAHDYLQARLPMIEYANFQAQGEPIGSGASESANKLVVERRLKGAGMHWERRNVNPMLTLTNTAANERWAELWPAATTHRRATRRQRLLDKHAPPPPAPPPPAPPPVKTPWRPAPDHPWRRFPTPPQPAPLAA